MEDDAAPAPRAPTEQSKPYLDEYARIKSDRLRERLHYLAHDPRIPAGTLRVWALSLMRWRAGDVDRHRTPILYPTPPSASLGIAPAEALEAIADVDRVVAELVPDFRAPRWRLLRLTREELEDLDADAHLSRA